MTVLAVLSLFISGTTNALEEERAPISEPVMVIEASEADVAYNVGVKNYHYNYAYALKWFRRAADLSSAEGQYFMGAAHEWGVGLKQDYAQALKWYRLSAEQQNKNGQYGLGSLYARGRGVEQDYTEAIKWYTLSAEQGVRNAQSELGRLLLEVKVGEKNYEDAYFWLSLAAQEKDEAREKRDEVLRHLTDEQVNNIHMRLKNWAEEHPPHLE